VNVNFDTVSGIFTVTHQYLDNHLGAPEDIYVIIATLSDDAGASSSAALAITVRNVVPMPPTVTLTEVSPDPRVQRVDTVTFQFSQPVINFDVNDLSLTRNGGENLLLNGATLDTIDNVTWQLGNLDILTAQPGTYELSLVAATSGIQDLTNVPLVENATETWTDIRQAGDASEDGQFSSLDIIFVLGAGLYETEQVAAWWQGDWNGDQRFSTGDIIAALSTGNYEQGPYIALGSRASSAPAPNFGQAKRSAAESRFAAQRHNAIEEVLPDIARDIHTQWSQLNTKARFFSTW